MDQVWEFYQLGLGDPWSVSSLHGNGTGDLLDAVVEDLKKVETADDEEEDGGINIAIIGRPNAGKSSLTNRLTSDDRSIVSNVAGTTRDAIDTVIEHDGQRYTIVDTAGLRQKSKIDAVSYTHLDVYKRQPQLPVRNVRHVHQLVGRGRGAHHRAAHQPLSLIHIFIEMAAYTLPYPQNFVPGHPMAGSEKNGIVGARADLFKGCLLYTSTAPPRRSRR